MDGIRKWFFSAICLLSASSGHAAIVVSIELLPSSPAIQPGEQIPDSAFSITAPSHGFISDPLNYSNGEQLSEFTIIDDVLGVQVSVYEGTYDTADGLPSHLSLFNTTGSKLKFEATDVDQDDVGVESWGFDSEYPISNSSNAALIFDFTASRNTVFQFGADLIDMEGGNGRNPYAGVYDAFGALIHEEALVFPEVSGQTNLYGDKEVRFVGLESLDHEVLSTVVFVVGDNDPDATGGSERLAAGDFYVGTKPVVATPIPAGIWLMLSGLLGALWFRKK